MQFANLPAKLVDRLRWEWREWHSPSRPSFQHEELDHALWTLIPWRAGERVLDVGCAHGEYLRRLADRRVDVFGVDVSMPSLLRARQHGRPLMVGSGDRLPVGDQSFDTILCHKTMYVFASPERTLREFSRVLRPGGRLVFSTSATRTPHSVMQRFAIRLLNNRNWAFGNRLGPATWVRLAREAGFEDARHFSCNLVVPLIFRVCDRWLIPNEWMRRYARVMRRISGMAIESRSPRRLAQDFLIVVSKGASPAMATSM